MASKKKSTKKIPATETIQFRPGEWLGQFIQDRADAWGISRGEAAKRLALLAVCGLGTEFHEPIDEIARISLTGFVDAARQVFVEIVIRERQQTTGEPLSTEIRKQVVQEILEKERIVNGVTLMEEKKQEVHVHQQR